MSEWPSILRCCRFDYVDNHPVPAEPINPDGPGAADYIEQLEAENTRYRTALQRIADTETTDKTWIKKEARATLCQTAIPEKEKSVGAGAPSTTDRKSG